MTGRRIPDWGTEDLPWWDSTTDRDEDPRERCEADVANNRVCLTVLDVNGNCQNESHHES